MYFENAFAEKNNTRLVAFKEEFHEIKGNLESLKNVNPKTIPF